MASIVSAGTTSATALNMSADTSGVLQLASNNGTVALTVATNQYVGVGTASPSTFFDVATGVGGTQNIATLRSGNVQFKLGTTDIGNGEVYYNVFPTSNSSAAGAHIWQGGGTGLMKLTNAGELLLGTATSNGAKFAVGTVVGSVVGTQSGWFAGLKAGYAGLAGLPQGQLAVYDTGTAVGAGGAISFMTPQGSDATWGAAIMASKVASGTSDYGCDLVFFTRPSGSTADARGRFTSTGKFYVSTPNGFGNGGLIEADALNHGGNLNGLNVKSGASSYAGVFNAPSNNFLYFTITGAGSNGTIQWNGTNTVYATSSDQRLKENIVDAPSALNKIDSVKIRSFNWIDSKVKVDFGVVAQELFEIAPEAVSVPQKEEDTWGVDGSVLVPAMIKAIQELNAKVTALENK